MSVHPIIARVGGKTKIAKKIVDMIPNHDTYVEPFIGGGSVFFMKKEALINVINDKDKDIYDIYKDITEVENIDDFKMNHPLNKEEFFRLLNQTNFENSKERLYRNIYLSKRSFSSNRKRPAVIIRKSGGITKLKKNYNNIREKLKRTIIHNEDYKEIIKKYDSKNTFFYLDPPYSELKENWDYNENNITREELLTILKTIKGKFLMTYDYNEKNIELFKPFFNIQTIEQIYKISSHRTNVKELIIKNY